MLVFVCMFVFGSILHVWEKTCSFCVSDPGLLHLTWCPLIAFIYLQTTCNYSFWLSNTTLCIPQFLLNTFFPPTYFLTEVKKGICLTGSHTLPAAHRFLCLYAMLAQGIKRRYKHCSGFLSHCPIWEKRQLLLLNLFYQFIVSPGALTGLIDLHERPTVWEGPQERVISEVRNTWLWSPGLPCLLSNIVAQHSARDTWKPNLLIRITALIPCPPC
jgi:hypothetical protein